LKKNSFVKKLQDMLKFICSGILLFIAINVNSQILISDAEIMLQSRHVWRGTMLGSAPAIEPSITFSANRFSFNLWAAVTPNNSYSEIDLIPAYQFKNFQLTLFDYYNPVISEKNLFLNFQEGKNRHSIELTADNFSIEKQRFKWMIGTFLLGDINIETQKAFYSTYLEFQYPFTILDIEAVTFIGLTPFRGYYADNFAFINTGISFSKSFKISQTLSVPINATYIFNPNQNNHFFVIASGIAFSKR